MFRGTQLGLQMTENSSGITCVFVDIGGVLLTNGWDHLARRRAVEHFDLNWDEMEERHRLTFEIHEEGKLSFEEYLNLVVFYEKRSFTRMQFRQFMCEQSTPYPEMIAMITQLKSRYSLKIAVVSNESFELNAYRIRTFKLDAFVDCFVSSCFVHLRKPDANMPMFVQIAEGLGIRSILHTDYQSTSAKLTSFGFPSSREAVVLQASKG
jgi:putative hydrolase of the HAD superfamily